MYHSLKNSLDSPRMMASHQSHGPALLINRHLINQGIHPLLLFQSWFLHFSLRSGPFLRSWLLPPFPLCLLSADMMRVWNVRTCSYLVPSVTPDCPSVSAMRFVVAPNALALPTTAAAVPTVNGSARMASMQSPHALAESAPSPLKGTPCALAPTVDSARRNADPPEIALAETTKFAFGLVRRSELTVSKKRITSAETRSFASSC